MDSFFLGILFAGLAALTWGVNSHLLNSGAQHDGPMVGLIYRAIISLPILFVVTLLFRDWDALLLYFDPFNFWIMILLVISTLFGDAVFIYAMEKYPVSVILPVATSYPLLVSVILIVFGIEEVTLLIILGTIAVVIGIYMVTKYRYDTETKQHGINLEAIFLGFLVSLGWGLSVIWGRIILDETGTESFGLMTVRTLWIGVIAVVMYFGRSSKRKEYFSKSKDAHWKSFKIFSLSGIFGWVLGATFVFLALENVKAAIATPISASNPIVAVFIGQLTGIDKINLLQFIGILITTCGVILIVI